MVEYIGGGCKCKDIENATGKKVSCPHTHEMKGTMRKTKKKGGKSGRRKSKAAVS